MGILSALKGALSKAAGFFSSGKAQRDFDLVVSLVPKALPYVELVASLTPTLADDQIVALFAKYGLPFATNYLALPQEQRGAALLRSASTLLAREVPGTPTRILDSAVQLALVGSRGMS